MTIVRHARHQAQLASSASRSIGWPSRRGGGDAFGLKFGGVAVRIAATTPASPETETEEEYYARLQEVCTDANKRHDVEGLCKGFRARLAKVVEKEGDAIGK